MQEQEQQICSARAGDDGSPADSSGKKSDCAVSHGGFLRKWRRILSRISTRYHTKRDIDMAFLSVCLSLCPFVCQLRYSVETHAHRLT